MKSPDLGGRASKIKKTARTLIFSGIISGAATPLMAQVLPSADMTNRLTSISNSPGQEGVLKDEGYWLDLAKKQPDQVLLNFNQISGEPYAYRVVEIIIDSWPYMGYLYYDSYKGLDDSDKLFARSVRNLLDKGQEGAEVIMFNSGNLELLSVTEIQEAAEKLDDIGVLNHLNIIFKYLPRDTAESIASGVLMRISEKDPFSIILHAKDIRTNMPNKEWIISRTIDYCVEKYPERVFVEMDQFMEAIPENERSKFVEKLISNDPVGVYKYIENSAGAKGVNLNTLKKVIFKEIVIDSTSPEAVILQQILNAPNITNDVKEKLPLLIDEFVSNKKFTLDEAVKTVEDKDKDNKLVKLIGKITHRPHYLGRTSIGIFLSTPGVNKIIDLKSN